MSTVELSKPEQITLPRIDESRLLPVSLRDDFPILQQTVHGDRPLVFLDNAASTQRPRQVIEVLRRVYERDYANVHRGIHTLSERSTEQSRRDAPGVGHVTIGLATRELAPQPQQLRLEGRLARAFGKLETSLDRSLSAREVTHT